MKQARRSKKHRDKVGKPPGTLVYTGEQVAQAPLLTLFRYNLEACDVIECPTLESVVENMQPDKVNWLNVDALHDIDLMERIGQQFELHNLLLEDVLNVDQLPKVEDFGERYFVTLRMMALSPEDKTLYSEQVSFVLGNNYLISFQERQGDVFEPVRNRIKEGLGKSRGKGPDYLLFALIDVVVDNYFFVIEGMNDELAELEHKLTNRTENQLIYRINADKQQLFQIRKAVTPLREGMRKLVIGDSKLIHPKNIKYFNDVIDHLNSIQQDIEIQRDMLSGYVDVYNTNLNNKMNNVMKTLTIIATIFIPLTFIAGVYGMNFDNMPELHWEYGYPTVLAVMLVSGLAMFIYMKRRDWL